MCKRLKLVKARRKKDGLWVWPGALNSKVDTNALMGIPSGQSQNSYDSEDHTPHCGSQQLLASIGQWWGKTAPHGPLKASSVAKMLFRGRQWHPHHPQSKGDNRLCLDGIEKTCSPLATSCWIPWPEHAPRDCLPNSCKAQPIKRPPWPVTRPHVKPSTAGLGGLLSRAWMSKPRPPWAVSQPKGPLQASLTSACGEGANSNGTLCCVLAILVKCHVFIFPHHHFYYVLKTRREKKTQPIIKSCAAL